MTPNASEPPSPETPLGTPHRKARAGLSASLPCSSRYSRPWSSLLTCTGVTAPWSRGARRKGCQATKPEPQGQGLCRTQWEMRGGKRTPARGRFSRGSRYKVPGVPMLWLLGCRLRRTRGCTPVHLTSHGPKLRTDSLLLLSALVELISVLQRGPECYEPFSQYEE